MLVSRTHQSRFARLCGTIAVALTLVGCGGSSSRGAFVSLQWSVFDLGDTTRSQHCASVGAGNAVLTLTNQTTQVVYTSTFACSDYGGASIYVPPGTYDAALSLYGDSGNKNSLLDQQVLSGVILLSGPNDPGFGDFLVNSFVLGWAIASGGVTITCGMAGASEVELDVFYPNDTTATVFYFPCGVEPSATLAIPMGPYTVRWKAFLLDANGADIGTGTTLQRADVLITSQADLGTVIFSI